MSSRYLWVVNSEEGARRAHEVAYRFVTLVVLKGPEEFLMRSAGELRKRGDLERVTRNVEVLKQYAQIRQGIVDTGGDLRSWHGFDGVEGLFKRVGLKTAFTSWIMINHARVHGPVLDDFIAGEMRGGRRVLKPIRSGGGWAALFPKSVLAVGATYLNGLIESSFFDPKPVRAWRTMSADIEKYFEPWFAQVAGATSAE